MTFSIIADIVLAILGILIILKFTFRGFLRSVLDTLKFPLALVIAYLVRIPVAKGINSMFMKKAVVGWVEESLLTTASGGDSFIDFAKLYQYTPKLFTKVLSSFGLENPERLESLGGVKETEISLLASDIGSAISMLLSNVLAVIILFIIIVILMAIVVKLIDGFTKIKAVKIINIILGFILGLALAFITLWLLSFGLELVVKYFGDFAPDVLSEEALDRTMIIGAFRQIDLLGWFK